MAAKKSTPKIAQTPAATARLTQGGVRIDAKLAQHNVQIATRAVLAERDRLVKELPGVSVKHLEGLPALALALVESDLAVRATATAESDLAGKLAAARLLRQKLLVTAESLALAALLPAARVKKIREGSGAFDTAGDLVALAALFTEHAAALRGKSPIAAAEVKQAGALGSELLARLKPGRAKKNTVISAAATTRADLAAQLIEAHRLLRRVGMWLFGEETIDHHVPTLQARARAAAKTAKAAKAAKRELGSEAAD